MSSEFLTKTLKICIFASFRIFVITMLAYYNNACAMTFKRHLLCLCILLNVYDFAICISFVRSFRTNYFYKKGTLKFKLGKVPGF